MKLNLVLTEYYTTTSWRKLEIDTNDYPLLKGKTEEEAQSYIQNLYEQRFNSGNQTKIKGVCELSNTDEVK